jgi:hypothetical protein
MEVVTMTCKIGRIFIFTIVLLLTFLIFQAEAQNNPPVKPTLVSPSNGGYVNTLTPELIWNVPTDAEEDMCHFKFSFSENNDMSYATTLDSSNDTTNFTPTPPLTPGISATCKYSIPSGTYSQFSDGKTIYWTVTANDGTDDSPTSDIYSFTIDTGSKSDKAVIKEDRERMQKAITAGVCRTSMRFLNAKVSLKYQYSSATSKKSCSLLRSQKKIALRKKRSPCKPANRKDGASNIGSVIIAAGWMPRCGISFFVLFSAPKAKGIGNSSFR